MQWRFPCQIPDVPLFLDDKLSDGARDVICRIECWSEGRFSAVITILLLDHSSVHQMSNSVRDSDRRFDSSILGNFHSREIKPTEECRSEHDFTGANVSSIRQRRGWADVQQSAL